MQDIRPVIEAAWEGRGEVTPETGGEVREAVAAALRGLDTGELQVVTGGDGDWTVHEWLKKAILLAFRLNPGMRIPGGPGGGSWWDRIPSKLEHMTASDFEAAGFRAVPGSIVRRPAFVGRDVVLMPCFVNVGAWIGERTMIDTWATVGSCARVGANCHISGGTGIGGVLEPLQARPVIIEDDCFIGARSEIVEGVVVGRGAVLAMGCHVGASTRIVDRRSGEIIRGRIPPGSVVVPGSLPGPPRPDGGPVPALGCVVIVKTVDAQTRAKTSLNELLREGDR